MKERKNGKEGKEIPGKFVSLAGSMHRAYRETESSQRGDGPDFTRPSDFRASRVWLAHANLRTYLSGRLCSATPFFLWSSLISFCQAFSHPSMAPLFAINRRETTRLEYIYYDLTALLLRNRSSIFRGTNLEMVIARLMFNATIETLLTLLSRERRCASIHHPLFLLTDRASIFESQLSSIFVLGVQPVSSKLILPCKLVKVPNRR